MSHRTRKMRILTLEAGHARRQGDTLAVEEPLEMQLQAGGRQRTLAVTMRTPGNDYELTAGFLYAEGIISSRHDVSHMTYCVGEAREQQTYNLLTIGLRRPALPDLPHLERHFTTTSACGICGTTYLDDLAQRALPPLADGPCLTGEQLFALPEKLRAAQAVFDKTGGLHAAALFGPDGTLVAVREDIGRHNALDKVLGWGVLNDRLPFHNHLLLVSGRASYELLQKARVAGIGFFCAVSAPSSLAVAVAERFGITLVGFLRGERCNVYTHPARIDAPKP